MAKGKKSHKKKVSRRARALVLKRRRITAMAMSGLLALLSISAVFLSTRVVVDLTTDKIAYAPTDDALFYVSVKVPTAMSKVFGRVRGIQNARGRSSCTNRR